MASRIGKQRKQKKYSEGGVVFTPAFIARIPSAAAAKGTDDASSDDFHAALAAFWARLRGFTALGSAEAELHGVHDLVGALAALAPPRDRAPSADDGARVPIIADDDDAPPAPATGERELAFVAAARAFFGVMFLPNSRQLHRALITSRKKLGTRGAQLAESALLAETSAAIDDALAELMGERNALARPTATVMRPATALASVNMVQPQGWAERRVLRGVAVRAASLIAAGIDGMIDETLRGRRVPPTEMEIAHDAVAVAYSLVQRHLSSIVNVNVPGSSPAGGVNAIAALARALARILGPDGSQLSREAAVSAGVTFSALLGIGATPATHACALADAFFPRREGNEETLTPGVWRVTNGVGAPPIDSLRVLAAATADDVLAGFESTKKTAFKSTAAPFKDFPSLASSFSAFGTLSAVRGALTAAGPEALSLALVRPGGNGNTAVNGDAAEHSWRFLVDGAIPKICAWMEHPVDQHFKFHASAALKSALARAKTCVVAGGDESFAMPPALVDRVLTALWANWEDPLTQTVKEVQGAFEALTDLFSKSNGFLERVASRLLERGVSTKGRYVPLAALVPKLGARKLLDIRPNLLEESLDAMRDDSVCCAAGTLIKELSAKLLDEMEEEERNSAAAAVGIEPGTPERPSGERWVIGNGSGKRGGVDKGRGRGRDEVCIREECGAAVAAWRRWWIPPTLAALLKPGRERAGCAQYALPHLMRQDAASIVFLLEGLKKKKKQKKKKKKRADDASEKDGNEGDEEEARREEALRAAGVGVTTLKLPIEGDEIDDEDSRGDDTDDDDDEDEDGLDDERRSAALVALLKRARAASLLDADTGVAFVCESVSRAAAAGVSSQLFSDEKNPPSKKDPSELDEESDVSRAFIDGKYPVDEAALARATVCRDRGVRKEALELLCVDGKRSSAPSATELRLLRRALPTAMRGESAAFRNALGTMIRSLLGRIKTCQTRTAAALRTAARLEPKAETSEKRADLEFDLEKRSNAAELCAEFTEWLVRLALASAYPGAPYERKYMALDVLNAVAETWGVGRVSDDDGRFQKRSTDFDFDSRAERLERSPYRVCLGADVTTALLGALVDSWDKLRVAAFTLLARHPSPLAGVTSAEEFGARARWALRLLRSPRVRESDAAALLMRLLLRKYAVDLGWDVTLSPEPKATATNATNRTKGETAARLLGTMCDLIEVECVKAEEDLVSACKQSLAHGALLATRYVLAEIDFNAGREEGHKELKAALARLLSLLNRVTGVALSSIASPDGALLGTAAGELEPDRLGGGSGQGAAAAAAAAAAAVGSASAFDDDADAIDDDDDVDVDDAAGETCGGENLAPKAQMITTACWLTMKEVSLTIGELARGVPVDDETLLDPAALKACGEHLLHVLLSMKHNGAIEKTRVGLVCLGERLLRSSNPELSALPSDWLASLFNRLTSPEQGISDLIRRSAGLPFGFTAVFLAEPAGVPRKLLHGAMARLLDIAADDGEHVRAGGGAKGTSEGVHVPQVHAFNVLRQAFSLTELATETTAFVAAGITVCVRGFKSPHWEVRNGATLAYASLVTKTCGYGNSGHSAPVAGGASRRRVTGAEFFRRYPKLHPFLLAELSAAADSLEKPGSPVHPSLWPILAMLSRLRPSEPLERAIADTNVGNPSRSGIDGETENSIEKSRMSSALSPAAFAPVVRRCAIGRPAAIRAAAARALAPLVDPCDVASVTRASLRNLREDRQKTPKNAKSPCPGVGHNAAHGILLCVKALFAPEGPASALLRKGVTGVTNPAASPAASYEALIDALAVLAVGLEECAYLALESPSAACAAEWLGCAERCLALAEEALGVADSRAFLEKLRVLTWQGTELVEGDERFAAHVDARRRSRENPSGKKIHPSDRDEQREPKTRAAGERSNAPHDVLWAKTAARLRVKLALTGGVGPLALDSYISIGLTTTTLTTDGGALSPSVRYEARGSALKALRDAGVDVVDERLDLSALLTHVSNVVLPAERRHSCKRRALRLVGDWTERTVDESGDDRSAVDDRSAGDDESEDAEWATVERLASADPNERTRCAAVACLGRLAAVRVNSWERSVITAANKTKNPGRDAAANAANAAVRRASTLVGLIAAGSSPERPEDVRRASAEALAASALLSRLPPAPGGQRRTKHPETNDVVYHDDPCAGPTLGEPVLRAWIVAFELLEDEDEDVRAIVGTAVTSRQNRSLGVPRDASTEECLRLAFAAVATRLARWPPYERYLLATCVGPPVDADQLRKSIEDVGVVRRLFDREADNHHAESLLLAQLAARAITRTDAVRVRVLETELACALDGVEAATAALAGVSIGESPPGDSSSTRAGDSSTPIRWEGGATNHEVAFGPFCRAALGAWALTTALTASGCHESFEGVDKKKVSDRARELDKTLRKIGLAPMAAATWANARRALIGAKDWRDLENEEGSNAEKGGGAYARVGPCFLLE